MADFNQQQQQEDNGDNDFDDTNFMKPMFQVSDPVSSHKQSEEKDWEMICRWKVNQ